MSLALATRAAACGRSRAVASKPSMLRAKRVLPEPPHADYAFKLHSKPEDLSSLVGVGMFLAHKQGIIPTDPTAMSTALAVTIFALPVANLLIRKENYYWVSSALAPLALATAALNFLTIIPAAITSFGTRLCHEVQGELNIKGSYFVMLATLAAAVAYKHVAVWYCAAYAFLAGLKFINGTRSQTVFVVPGVLFFGVAYALFQFIRNSSTYLVNEVCVCLIFGQLAWSIFSIGQSFTSDVQDA